MIWILRGMVPNLTFSVTSYRCKLLSRNSTWPGVLRAMEVTVGGTEHFPALTNMLAGFLRETAG